MNDPRRFLDGGGTELERMLLASGRAVRPGRIGKARTGIVLWLVEMGLAPSLFARLRLTVRPWLLARWVAVGLGTGAAAWGTVRVVQSQVQAPAAVAPDSADIPSVRRAVHPSKRAQSQASPSPIDAPRPGEGDPNETTTNLSESTANAGEPTNPGESTANAGEPTNPNESTANPREFGIRPTTKGTSSSSMPGGVAGLDRMRSGGRIGSETGQGSKSSVAAEIHEIDAARRFLQGGDPRGALHRLDRYAKMYPKGAFEQEQIRLRIEALVALGELDSARALARKFLTSYPESAHRRRLETLVGSRP